MSVAAVVRRRLMFYNHESDKWLRTSGSLRAGFATGGGSGLAVIRLLVLDVDGVLTSGELPYEAGGNTVKTFHALDGSAIRLWQDAGNLVTIISGRSTPAVEARARDLGIGFVRQGVTDKLPAYEEARRYAQVEDAATAVIGDDYLDLPLLQRCGYPIAVANAVPRVKRVARLVTRRFGGSGAIGEAVERLLRLNGQWAAQAGRWDLPPAAAPRSAGT